MVANPFFLGIKNRIFEFDMNVSHAVRSIDGMTAGSELTHFQVLNLGWNLQNIVGLK